MKKLIKYDMPDIEIMKAETYQLYVIAYDRAGNSKKVIWRT